MNAIRYISPLSGHFNRLFKIQVQNRSFQYSRNLFRYGRYVCVNLENRYDATYFLASLTAEEKKSLLSAVKQFTEEEAISNQSVLVTTVQLRSLFVANCLPFIGFGIFDNVIMIVAGEYIDNEVGTLLGISTMAAAAIGNLISDIGGIGIGNYIELLVSKLGLTAPLLSAKQLRTKRVRWTINMGRIVGIVIGCFIGMFPLLFFNVPSAKATRELKKDVSQNG
ncbi:hypothetical protein M514_00017 [Trichuris suis]|uniref:Transmembrane protein 65 n=1 Tax=Trichuris suis TaxID=68888 RepID=A0A085NTR6_9BILA|nr:hypothetical protein M513_00017 [Trichuris suis]KFD72862.1 hypothetical protein M514_00017 [Trichuris suis]